MTNWILGLTGGIGSGKTAASDYLASKGIAVVDSDLVARAVVEPHQPAWSAIREHFGDAAINADSSLNRGWLRQQVFANPDERRWLEQLTHPLIRARTLEMLAAATSEYVILASPLLLESGQQTLVNHTLVIDVPEDIQVQRACQRDANNEEQIRAIIKAQIPRPERLARANDVADNSGPLNQLYEQLNRLHQSYLDLAKAHHSHE